MKEDFMYANLSDVQIIYAVHKKNKRKIVETFVDFSASRKLKIFSYKILLIRPATEKDVSILRKIDEEDKAKGYSITRFIQRFWCHPYKTLSQLIDDDKDLVDEKMLEKIIEATKNEFLKLNKNQLEILF
ncbi:hypothetical protein WAF17_21020 [Bernardetia sp. ABR2-2B]|uniref:hypothetical protein n=1 Tax=Bernardetia sp. ABR2-2B TaxID=3127472 RepID=UPI0030D401BF